MLTSIPTKPKFTSKQPFSQLLNPQKPSQHTSQSQQPTLPTPQQYIKLQNLLQSRQASLRQHAKHQYQLKLYIQDLQQKNKLLQNNNTSILNTYKTQLSLLKKQNQSLRKMLKKIQTENIQLKRQLNTLILTSNDQIHHKSPLNNNFNQTLQQKSINQSVIKIIESQDPKQSLRQTVNARLLPYNLSGKQAPSNINIQLSHKNNQLNLRNTQSNYKNSQLNNRNQQSQSKQKLQVTMKSSRQIQKPQSTTHGRNQKNITSLQLLTKDQNNLISHYEHKLKKYQDSIHPINDRSIKKLYQIKRMNESNEEQVKNKKLILERNSRMSQHKKTNQGQQSNNDKNMTIEQQLSDNKLGKSVSKQLNQVHKRSGSKLSQQQKSKSLYKNKNNNDLIKLGHYGHVSSQRIIKQPAIQ